MPPTLKTSLVTAAALGCAVPGRGGDAGSEVLARNLALTPEQQAAVDAILLGGRNDLRARTRGLRDARRKLVEACIDPDVSRDTLAWMARQVADQTLELHRSASHAASAVGEILTPDQRRQERLHQAEAAVRIRGILAYLGGL